MKKYYIECEELNNTFIVSYPFEIGDLIAALTNSMEEISLTFVVTVEEV